MDGQRSDDLTRSLAAGTTRRHALKLLAGGAVGAVAGLFRLGGAGATHTACGRHHFASCRRDDQCCSGRCAGAEGEKTCLCPATAPIECGGTRCCTTGQTCCNGRCVDTDTNENHCGECNNDCDGGEVCRNGTCRCPAGHRCPAGTTCTAQEGVCRAATCPAGTQACADNALIRCDPNTADCYCFTRSNGTTFCGDISASSCGTTGDRCDADNECPPGYGCVDLATNCNCPGNPTTDSFCVPPCSSGTVAAAGTADSGTIDP